jgi:membrane-associated protease RseP (regulator of RpoE activity)
MTHGFDVDGASGPLLMHPARVDARNLHRLSLTGPVGRIVESLPFCVVLFLLTILTTLIVGVHLADNYARHLPIFDLDISASFFTNLFRHPARLWMGAPYSLTLIGILLAHELGHYFTCRHYAIEATYPLFIPAPTLIGTLGAFIRIKSPLVTRQELFDVGISGPIAGFIVAIPALVVAAWRAGSGMMPATPGTITLGQPLAISFLARLFHPEFHKAHWTLTPVGCGVWVGLFATALNLLPIGQLDGGHIVYAVFGRKHRYVSFGFFAALLPLGIFCWLGWIFWAVLMLFLGLRHPTPLIDSETLDRRRKFLAILALAIFILCFTLTPFTVK